MATDEVKITIDGASLQPMLEEHFVEMLREIASRLENGVLLDAEPQTELPRPPPPPPGRQMRSGWFGEYETKESIKARENYEAFMRGYRYAYGRDA